MRSIQGKSLLFALFCLCNTAFAEGSPLTMKMAADKQKRHREHSDSHERGKRGESGEPGAPGAPGRRGERGKRGVEGLQGVQGAQGNQGTQGVQGPSGPAVSGGITTLIVDVADSTMSTQQVVVGAPIIFNDSLTQSGFISRTSPGVYTATVPGVYEVSFGGIWTDAGMGGSFFNGRNFALKIGGTVNTPLCIAEDFNWSSITFIIDRRAFASTTFSVVNNTDGTLELIDPTNGLTSSAFIAIKKID